MRIFAVLLVVASAFGQSAQSLITPDWTRPIPPFRLIGNVYWVGTWDLSSYLITTPAGHILVNTGLAGTASQIKSGIEQLGFKLSDVRILTATHGHFDHVAGLAQIKRWTGARVIMSEPDAELLESGGRSDFFFGDDPGARFEPVHVDRRLANRDRIELGGMVLTAHLHPGHTKGATSFTFDVRENGRIYRVGIMNMPTINQGVRLTGMPNFPDIAGAYLHTFNDQKGTMIDVWLASHAAQFALHGKYRPGDAYNRDRFLDSRGFQAAVARLEQAYKNQLTVERSK